MKRKIVIAAIIVFIVLAVCGFVFSIFNMQISKAESPVSLFLSYQEGRYYINDGRAYKEVPDDEWDSCIIDLKAQYGEISEIIVDFSSSYRHPVMLLDPAMEVIAIEYPRSGEYRAKLDPEIQYITIGFKKTEGSSIAVNGIGSYEDINDRAEADDFRGKYVSLLGDSLSAYSGYIKAEYFSVYPAADVSVQDMWWYRVAKELGMSICNVNACASSGVTELDWNGLTPEMAGSAGRGRALGQLNRTPDVIFVMLGGNDIIAGAPRNEISRAYRQMMNDITSSYPYADIYLFTYDLSFLKVIDPDDWLNNEIRAIAEEYNVNLIDMKGSGLSEAAPETVFIDADEGTYNLGVHPNKAGFQIMAEHIVEKLLETDGNTNR